MATIGLDKLYYASISEDPTSGEETYAVPKPLAKAISAELSVAVSYTHLTLPKICSL